MSIRSIGATHQAALKNDTPGDRDSRFYLDFRQEEYPDIKTGSAEYTKAREGNLIDRGNCELAGAPMIFGETVPYLNDATWERSADFFHTGAYSYKFTKTVAAGTVARAYMSDNASAGDMHGLTSGSTYTLSAWVYIPTASGILGEEVFFHIIDSEGSAPVAAANTYDAWQLVTATRTVDAAASLAYPRISTHSDAADTEYFYVDDIRLTSHNYTGSHYLSSGYTEHLLEMPDTFTIQLTFIPAFAYDVGTDQHVASWYVSDTQEVRIYYYAGW